jgi:hypothetical protein
LYRFCDEPFCLRGSRVETGKTPERPDSWFDINHSLKCCLWSSLDRNLGQQLFLGCGGESDEIADKSPTTSTSMSGALTSSCSTSLSLVFCQNTPRPCFSFHMPQAMTVLFHRKRHHVLAEQFQVSFKLRASCSSSSFRSRAYRPRHMTSLMKANNVMNTPHLISSCFRY